MAGTNMWAALAGLAQGAGEAFTERNKQKFDAEQAKLQRKFQIGVAAIQSGQLADTPGGKSGADSVFDWLFEDAGKGHGKAKDALPGIKKLTESIRQAHAAPGGPGGAEAAPSPFGAGQAPATGGPDTSGRQTGPEPTTVPSRSFIPPVPGRGAAAPAPGGIPPVPGTTESGRPQFVSRAQATKEARDVEIDKAWVGAAKEPFYNDNTGKWVIQNPISGETRPAPGAPLAAEKAPISSLPGTVEGKQIIDRFSVDMNGAAVDPNGHYRQIKQGNQVIGVTPTEAPASEGPTKSHRERVAGIKAATAGISDAAAEKQASLEERKDEQQKTERTRAQIANDWEGLTGKTLSNEIKQRLLDGKLTRPQAIQMARGLWQGSGKEFGVKELQKTADDILATVGGAAESGGAAGEQAGGKLPPVPGAAAPDGGKEFGKPKKLSAPAQRTVDTARDVLDFIPKVTGPLIASGVSNDNSLMAAGKVRFNNWLYAAGISPAEWRNDVIQYGDTLRAFVLTGLLAGRTNKALQDLLDKHIPNPDKDTPLQMMRKLKNMEDIARTASKNALEGATLTPQEMIEKIKAMPDPFTGAGPTSDNPYRK